MDSEQLVSNPFQELIQKGSDEANKKNSNTEKLTSVKNNVCENHYQMEKLRLERQRTSMMKSIHDGSNKLRHEVCKHCFIWIITCRIHSLVATSPRGQITLFYTLMLVIRGNLEFAAHGERFLNIIQKTFHLML